MASKEELEASRMDTRAHKYEVQAVIEKIVEALIERSGSHDNSKMEEPELDMFATWGPRLKSLLYGSEAYKDALASMGPALEHHYAVNSHHPEYYDEGVDGMDLIDLIEMVADWKAASKRVKDGGFTKSLAHNTKRFNLSPQLVKIIANTKLLEE